MLLILSRKKFKLVKYKEEASKRPCGPFGAKPVNKSFGIHSILTLSEAEALAGFAMLARASASNNLIFH